MDLPDEDARLAHLPRLFATLTRHHHLAGGGVEVACDGPSIGAAALWDPPNRWTQSPRAQLAMMASLIRTFGLRSVRARGLVELMKREHPEEQHWYLAVIGSDTPVRGRGFGQALMRSRLDRCDAQHCPAYLESSKPDNVPYYERFGFTVTGEIVLPDGRANAVADVAYTAVATAIRARRVRDRDNVAPCDFRGGPRSSPAAPSGSGGHSPGR